MRPNTAIRIAAALAVTFGLAACSSNEGEAAGDIQAKAKAGNTVIIGVTADQPGLALKTPDGYEGYDIEVAKIIAKGLGVAPDKIEWKTTVSINREPFLAQGVVDLVVSTYTINDNRKQVVAFGGPYYVAGQDLLVQTDSTITGPEDLNDKKVCSVVGSASATRMEKDYPEAQLQLFDSYSKCITALLGGGVDAVTTDDILMIGYMAQPQYAGKFKLVGKPFSVEPYGVGINKQDVAGCRKVNEILVAASEDGSLDKAWEATLGSSGQKPQKVDPKALTNCT